MKFAYKKERTKRPSLFIGMGKQIYMVPERALSSQILPMSRAL